MMYIYIYIYLYTYIYIYRHTPAYDSILYRIIYVLDEVARSRLKRFAVRLPERKWQLQLASARMRRF